MQSDQERPLKDVWHKKVCDGTADADADQEAEVASKRLEPAVADPLRIRDRSVTRLAEHRLRLTGETEASNEAA